MSNNGRARKEEQAGHVTFLGEEGERAWDVPGGGPNHALESAWRKVVATEMACTGQPIMTDSVAGKQESDIALSLSARKF